MRYGLSAETIKRVIEVFSGYEQIETAVIYCSRAKGNFKPGSDIDIALKGPELDLKLLNKISLDLDDLLLPYTFDLSLYHQIANPDLIEHIKRVNKVVYQKDREVN